jgi:hypothetical protein
MLAPRANLLAGLGAALDEYLSLPYVYPGRGLGEVLLSFPTVELF